LGKTPPISRLQNTSRHLSERKEWILNQSVECVDKGVHFIKPYTTRPLREGETDKISVSIEQYCDMEERGMFAYDNPLYGVRYGTPIEPIRNAYTEGKIPLLDFPLKDLNKLQLPGDIALVGIYCFPPSIKTWMNRITRDARANMSRVFAARELWRLQDTQYLNSNIHFAIINSEGESLRASNEIHDFLQKKYS